MHAGVQPLASKRKRLRVPPVEPGQPTPERMRHAQGNVERGDMGVYTLRDSPIERALDRRIVSQKQYDAAVKYRMHWYRGGLSAPLQSLDLNRIFATDVFAFSGMAKTEAQAHHRQQYRAAVQEIGIIPSAIVEHVVCHEKSLENLGISMGWNSKPKGIDAAGKVLRDALDKLCGLWGI